MAAKVSRRPRLKRYGAVWTPHHTRGDSQVKLDPRRMMRPRGKHLDTLQLHLLT